MRFGVLVACVCLPGVAAAQTDMMAMAHESAANQLGVLEYCQAQGYTDGSAVLAEQGVISRMPAYAGSTAAAEATGKAGTIAANGQSVSLSDMAAKGHSTQAGLCQQMAASAKQAAASNAASFGPGGVPRMPGGMPAMPGGMPAMPAMPGAPQPQ